MTTNQRNYAIQINTIGGEYLGYPDKAFYRPTFTLHCCFIFLTFCCYCFGISFQYLNYFDSFLLRCFIGVFSLLTSSSIDIDVVDFAFLLSLYLVWTKRMVWSFWHIHGYCVFRAKHFFIIFSKINLFNRYTVKHRGQKHTYLIM